MQNKSPRALITGASRGIGKAIALALAARKYNLALVARTEAALQDTCRACEAAGAKALAIGADLANPEVIPSIVQKAENHMGGVDVLVNNAGVVLFENVRQAHLPAWDLLMDINVRAVMHLTHYALPALTRGKNPAVINVASVAALRTGPTGGAYNSSKHALLAFSECLFEDVRADGIKVCSICPGFVETDMLQGSGLDADKAIRPEDIAQAALYVLDSGPRACPTAIVIQPQLKLS